MLVKKLETIHEQLRYIKDGLLHHYCKLEKDGEIFTVELHENTKHHFRVDSDRITGKDFTSFAGAMAFFHRCVGAFVVGGCIVVPVEQYEEEVDKFIGYERSKS